MAGRILMVDDETFVLSSMQRSLRNRFEISTANSGIDGLEVLRSSAPFAVVVSDYQMPEMNGIEFLSQCRILAPDTVRIMLTGQADMRVAVNAVNQGHIFQFLCKPCPTEQLEAALSAAIEYYTLKESEKDLLDKTLKGSIKVLFDVLAMINPTAFNQASRLRQISRRVAKRLKMPNLWEVELSALLSLIGCVTIPEDILTRKVGMQRLTPEEIDVFNSHIRAGSRLVANIPRLEGVSKAIAYQQKRYDGSGLPPDEVMGLDIPMMGRLLKLILDYDELHQLGISTEKALVIMREHSSWYDPDMLLALENELSGTGETFLRKNVRLDELAEGMVTIQSVYDERGRIVLGANQEINGPVIQQLINYQKMSPIVQPILVITPLPEFD